MTLITIMQPISRRSRNITINSRRSFSELFRNQLINLTGAHPHTERERERVESARDGGGFLHKWKAMRIYDRDSSQPSQRICQSKSIGRRARDRDRKGRGTTTTVPPFGIVPTASSTLVNCNWRPDVRKRSDFDDDDNKRRQTGDTWPKRGMGGGE